MTEKLFISCIAALFLAPSVALAQVSSQIEESGLELIIDAPTANSGGRIDCDLFGVDSCRPLNLKSCDGDGREIDIQISGSAEQNNRLLYFVTSNADCFFSNPDQLPFPLGSTQLNSMSDPLVTPTAFNFPIDTDDQGAGYGSVDGLLDATGACEGSGVDDSIYRLCFVVSPDASSATSGSAYAAILMRVDTVPPSATGAPSLTPGDGEINVQVNSDSNDILRWFVVYRPLPADADPDPDTTDSDCSTWATTAEAKTVSFDIVNQGRNTHNVSVANGQSYEFCVFPQDRAGNDGDYSDTAIATPRDECDFIECYPGELKTGYCGAGGGAGFAALAALLAFPRRRRRRA